MYDTLMCDRQMEQTEKCSMLPMRTIPKVLQKGQTEIQYHNSQHNIQQEAESDSDSAQHRATFLAVRSKVSTQETVFGSAFDS